MEKKRRIAIYPGSFNPFTTGHLNILEKAEDIFGADNVIIAVGVNPEKVKTIASPDQIGTTAIGHVPTDRVATIKHNLPSKNVEKYSGFLTDFVWEKEKAGFDVVIIRGLRNGDDFDYEINQLRFMKEMKPDVKVIFISCDKEFEHVSSSAYRMFEAVREGSGHRYLAKEYLPTTKQVADDVCVVFMDDTKENMIEKYTIMSKSKLGDEKYKFEDSNIKFEDFKFEGTYIECLGWIKEQETK